MATSPPPPREPRPQASRRASQEYRSQQESDRASTTSQLHDDDSPCSTPLRSRIWLLPPHAAKTLARSGCGPVSGFPPKSAGYSAPPPALTVSVPSPRLAPGPWGAVERRDEEDKSSVVVELDGARAWDRRRTA
ncbi:hypothetical protein B0T26DRAFT_752987 [Lasiosphaeria miniovina]|uniref:Uncharacterized protein n=1 Tax=Lasiosphaeria miniovina TaxID=1954250 RepID=A0AA40ABQ2_9PEZI|nr:uncharacterized protein B0T26DRAFT_752987 [Lasiosphaeria miniovina]KAK0712795.1 hypothetical protein B0T26DRAFT_752987 [Lasiosphaeria miniovina]